MKPHHLSMPTLDVLPADIHTEISGGLVDLYADDNSSGHLYRWRLAADLALALYRQLAAQISRLPIRLEDTE